MELIGQNSLLTQLQLLSTILNVNFLKSLLILDVFFVVVVVRLFFFFRI